MSPSAMPFPFLWLKRLQQRFCVAAWLSMAALFCLPAVAMAADFTVTNTNDSGAGSLRAAIEAANGNNNEPTVDRIFFAIPGAGVQTITLLASLPDITESLVIDGLSQGVASCDSWPPILLVEVDHDGFDGIVLDADNSTLAGLVVTNADVAGITVNGEENVVTCNFINVAPNGLSSASVGTGDGLEINGTENYVGPVPLLQTQGNLIAGSGIRGIELLVGDGNNTIQGNYIGVNVGLTTVLGKYLDGIFVWTDENQIGGTAALQGNVIGGADHGIQVYQSFTNTLQGNYIGIAQDGLTLIPNEEEGVQLIDAGATLVGGAMAGAGNLISGNGGAGIVVDNDATESRNITIQGNRIGTSGNGLLNRGNGSAGIFIAAGEGVLIGGTTVLARNLVSGNDSNGISVSFQTENVTIQGNYVGVNATGDAAIGNSGAGISTFINSGGILIGGDVAGAGNLVSGNGASGISMNETVGVTISGNFIGTNAAGTGALANGGNGIRLGTASNNIIGGGTAATRNLISGNTVHGIFFTQTNDLANQPQGPSVGNLVQGNYIGTTADGESALPNGEFGVSISRSLTNTIGGAAEGQGNLISGNLIGGVDISTDSFGFGPTDDNLITGNRIGTDKDGLTALANNGNGVSISDFAHRNAVGGLAAGEGNLIAGNDGHGVYITGGFVEDNLVLGNQIGLNGEGDALGNGGDGARFENSAPNHVGGVQAGAGNTIAFNGGNGVAIVATPQISSRKSILGNSIFENDGLGIDLIFVEGNVIVTGVTPNDDGDGDTGPNQLQNFPVLTLGQNRGGELFVEGTLSSATDTTYRVEFFAQAVCDPSGFGEGEQFLGFANVATEGDGSGVISVTLPLTLPIGTILTSTATDPENNTSEFGECVATVNAAPVAVDDVAATQSEEAVVVAVRANDSDADGDALTITAASEPTNGSVVINGGVDVTYTPDAGFAGVDTFTYTISDGNGGTDSAQVTVTVTAPTGLPGGEQPQQNRDLFLPNVER